MEFHSYQQGSVTTALVSLLVVLRILKCPASLEAEVASDRLGRRGTLKQCKSLLQKPGLYGSDPSHSQEARWHGVAKSKEHQGTGPALSHPGNSSLSEEV